MSAKRHGNESGAATPEWFNGCRSMSRRRTRSRRRSLSPKMMSQKVRTNPLQRNRQSCRAKRLLAAGDFPEDDDICREILVGAYPDEIEELDESGESLCWNILYDIFECDPEKAIEMWRYLLDIAGDLLKTDTETAEELLPDWDLFDPPDEYVIEPLFDALSDERFAEQVFGSAYISSLQPDILRVCFDNGANTAPSAPTAR